MVWDADNEIVKLPRGYRWGGESCDEKRDGEKTGNTLRAGWVASGDGVKIGNECGWGDKWMQTDMSRDAVIDFAADIADGLLDEIAEFLEQRAAAARAATEKLEAAKV